jgi:hypothetical protein
MADFGRGIPILGRPTSPHKDAVRDDPKDRGRGKRI